MELWIIRLLDEKGEVNFKWTLENVWPIEISSSNMNSDSNEVAIESLELAYESIRSSL